MTVRAVYAVFQTFGDGISRMLIGSADGVHTNGIHSCMFAHTWRGSWDLPACPRTTIKHHTMPTATLYACAIYMHAYTVDTAVCLHPLAFAAGLPPHSHEACNNLSLSDQFDRCPRRHPYCTRYGIRGHGSRAHPPVCFPLTCDKRALVPCFFNCGCRSSLHHKSHRPLGQSSCSSIV